MSERKWLNISQTEYHAMDAISSGALRCFALMGPLEYYARYVKRILGDKDSDAKRQGRAFHRAMEDREAFDAYYVIIPETIQDDEHAEEVNRRLDEKGSGAQRAKPGAEINRRLPSHVMYEKCWREYALANGKEILTAEELAKVKGQVAAVYDNPACLEFVGHKGACNVEVSCVTVDDDTQIPIKALCDLIVGECVVDFKTTRTRNPFDFIRQSEKEGYDYQAAHYLHVTGKSEFRFIAVANEPPYFSSVFYVPANLVKERHKENLRHLKSIRQLMTMAEFNPTCDSQGIPFDWMPEGWAGEYPLDMRELLNGSNV